MHAVLGYAAVHFNRVHVDRGLLLKALALYTLVNAGVSLITRRGFGEKVHHLPSKLPPEFLRTYGNECALLLRCCLL